MSAAPYEKLAGLDAIVLQFNTPTSSSSALDGIPYVAIPRPTQRRNSKRSGSPLVPRSPLQDKSNEFNIKSHNPLHRSPSSSRLAYSLHHQDSSQRSRNTSFHPLPPLPSASSLQLPFLDISYRPISPYLSSPSRYTSPHRLTSTPLSGPSHEQAQSSSAPEENNEPYWFPTLQHPNSPYVPWTSPVRRQFLRPLTPSSIASSIHRVHRQSQSHPRVGAQTPEVQEQDRERDQTQEEALHDPVQEDDHRQDHKGWRRHIGRILRQNMGQVAKRIARLTKPSKLDKANLKVEDVKPASRAPKIHFQSQSVGDVSRLLSRPHRPFTASPRSRSPSCASMLSTDTNSLAMWLAARQRENSEETDAPFLMLTLEEYELMGSWIDLSRSTKGEGHDWDCGIPGCDLHPSPAKEAAMTIATSSEKIAIQWSEAQGPNGGPSASASEDSPHLKPSRSFPQLPSAKWFESLEDVAGSLRMPTSKKRLSMPGGWAVL